MGRRSSYVPGTPCWVDLDVTDAEAAARFYGGIFRWRRAEAPKNAGYFVFTLDGTAVAGMEPMTEEDVAAGGRPGWNTYVSVTDVEASASLAADLGGTVVDEPHEVQDAGIAACIADPDGARLWLWQPDTFIGAGLVNEVNAWVWNDLLTPDPAESAPFYRELFGWEIAEAPGSGGVYWGVTLEGRRIGGIMKAPPGVDHPFWTVYFGAESVDEALERIQAAGGGRVTEPMDVPAGRFAMAHDTFGAPFGLIAAQYDP